MITAAQCRAGRGLLNWTQTYLAEMACLSQSTIHQFEQERKSPQRATLTVLKQTFERYGVEFLEGEGVRLKEQAPGAVAASPDDAVQASPRAARRPRHADANVASA